MYLQGMMLTAPAAPRLEDVTQCKGGTLDHTSSKAGNGDFHVQEPILYTANVSDISQQAWVKYDQPVKCTLQLSPCQTWPADEHALSSTKP